MATTEYFLANHSGNCERQDAVDWSVLDAFSAIQKPGTQDLRVRYVTLFLKSSLPLMESIKDAIIASDRQLLTISAHTLKTTCLMIGAMRLAATCARLEQVGRDNSLQDAGDLSMLAVEQYAAVTAVFREALLRSRK
jgi:HPt (histidine-containing phosphotransfer) domain-containing protein